MFKTRILLLCMICYLVLLLLTWFCRFHNSNRLFNTKGIITKNRGQLLLLHAGGIFSLFVLPLIFFHPVFKSFLRIDVTFSFTNLLLFILLSVLIAFTGFKTGSN